ncbi:lysozyme family protein [Enterococcus asini]|nr:lysozyme family protein [Enterococcus asini]MDT2756729.1 lysozyme family protein [Enterococcus asini]
MAKLLLLVLLFGMVALGVRNYKILKDVHQYDSEVAASVEKYGISQYADLASAIIYTESKAQTTDLMQSSESRYGETDQITSKDESIDAGVSFLAQAIKKAEEQGCDLSTGIQAYNFGLDYIDYVAEKGGKNSLKLAETYSKEVLAPQLGNEEQTQYRYWGLFSVFYNGGFLYHNGGNIFYAKNVQWNQWKYNATNFLF